METEINTKNLTKCSSAERVTQLNNASLAIAHRAISVGITTPNGVIIAADNTPPSRLYDVSTIHRVEMITKNIGMVFSGIHPDYRILVIASRKAAEIYYLKNRDQIPVKELVKNISTIMEDHTHSCEIRPFAVSLLICSWTEDCPQLYQVEPSGIFTSLKATAQGKNAVEVNQMLVEPNSSCVEEIKDAMYTAFTALKMGGCDMVPKHIQIGICDENGFRQLDEESVKQYMDGFVV